jgi:hypothetical protein
MTLDSSGNLGIGTSSPGSALEVKRTSGNSQIAVNYNDTNTGRIVAASNGNFYIGTAVGAGSVVIGNTANADAMTLDASGNLGVGTTSPSASAILDAQSTTKGVRMPNMTTTQKNAISSPAAGLMVFDTTLSKLCVYTGAAWQTITSV